MSSKQFSAGDFDELRSIFLSNGYPGRLFENLFFQNTTVNETFFRPENSSIDLKLPWIGNVPETFTSKIKLVTDGTFFASIVNCILFLKELFYHPLRRGLYLHIPQVTLFMRINVSVILAA